MKKIGIISELSLNTVNYGNNLQAYALGTYLKQKNPSAEIEYLVPTEVRKKRTLYSGVFFRKLKFVICRRLSRGNPPPQKPLNQRFEAFAQFRRNWFVSQPKLSDWKALCESDDDVLFVGSDVVWAQERFNVNRIKFLDFCGSKPVVKASYAASFANDWVPPENRRCVRKYLRDFQLISVREKTSVRFLQTIGINNAVHVLDPTLLLNAEEWEKIERRPEGDAEGAGSMVGRPFVFTYLLGTSNHLKAEIKRICGQNQLVLVTVPYADGKENEYDDAYGDVSAVNCSPEEWLWYIHHADYVITDSFHGVVFSTIFQKKFLVTAREDMTKINDRLYDYLDTIGQADKMVDLKKVGALNGMQWDYAEIDSLLEQKKTASEAFLTLACGISRP